MIRMCQLDFGSATYSDLPHVIGVVVFFIDTHSSTIGFGDVAAFGFKCEDIVEFRIGEELSDYCVDVTNM
jgi:hypothetical protein